MSDTSATNSVALAQARVDAARAQLAETMGTLQKRANPQTLASDAAEKLKVRGTEALTTAVETPGRTRSPQASWAPWSGRSLCADRSTGCCLAASPQNRR